MCLPLILPLNAPAGSGSRRSQGCASDLCLLAKAGTSWRRASCRCRPTGAQSPTRTLIGAPELVLCRRRLDSQTDLFSPLKGATARARRELRKDGIPRLRRSVRAPSMAANPVAAYCALDDPAAPARTCAVRTSRGAGRQVRAALASGSIRATSAVACCVSCACLRLPGETCACAQKTSGSRSDPRTT